MRLTICAVGLLGLAMSTAGCGTQVASPPPSQSTSTIHSHVSTRPSENGGAPTTSTSSVSRGPSGAASPPAPDSGALPSPPSSTTAAATFPALIREAMADVPTSMPVRMAPSVLPLYTSGPNPMFYMPTIQSPPQSEPPPGYTIQLSSPRRPLAMFGVMPDESGKTPTLQVLVSGLKQGTVSLGGGLVGTNYGARGGPGGPGPWVAIAWSEGRWQVAVIQYGETTPPVVAAKYVVQQLSHYYLPVPDGHGLLVEQLGKTTQPAGPQPGTDIQWQLSGHQLAQIQTYDDVNYPLRTAIRMAISFKPYP